MVDKKEAFPSSFEQQKRINTQKEVIVITDEYIKEHGFKEYNPTRFDNDSVILKFQKRYDDDFGKKYFINILKWDNSYVPADRRDKWWRPYSYTYETQITMFKDCKALNFEFFSDWTLEQVENFMEDLFEKMKVNYYESWNDESGYRPKEDYRNN